MNALLCRVHRLWCAVTGRCPVDLTPEKERLKSDPYISWMADQEQASIAALQQRRKRRRQNFIEAEMTRGREGMRRDH